MITDLIRRGDKVTITIPADNREWGYNPCPDGTEATVVGFEEITYGRIKNFGLKPGVYENHSWVELQLDNGKSHTEYSGRVDLVNKEEYDRRVREFRKRQEACPDDWTQRVFLRDLPETPFWEGDYVSVSSRQGRFQIVRIDYSKLQEKRDDGSLCAAYDISDSLDAGWYTSATEDEITLLERGLVWKYYHNEPLEFASVKDEANLYYLLGRTKEVRNPANGLYSWTKDEVLDAIKKGVAHGFSVSGGLFGCSPRPMATWFVDEEVGKRVAAETLSGFAVKEPENA